MSFSVFTIDREGGASVIHNGSMLSVPVDHPKYDAITDLLRQQRYDEAVDLIDLQSAVRSWIGNHPHVELREDRLFMENKPFTSAVTEKVLNMIERGNDAEPLVKFLRRVRNNPSNVAQRELLLFCEANGFMISECGRIVAYKSVRGDYNDIYSGRFDNSVGSIHSMDRRDVDDRREVTCSHGFHFASYEYASTWSGRIDGDHRRLMVLLVDPADVVSIPNDYHNQKGRCCRYKVVAEVQSALPPQEVYTNEDLGAEEPDNYDEFYDDMYREIDELEQEVDREVSELEREGTSPGGVFVVDLDDGEDEDEDEEDWSDDPFN